MILRLDPRLSFVWRTPHTLQLGADRPSRLVEVTPGDERMLAALRIGTTREGLDIVAERAGLAPGAAAALLDRLGGAVVRGSIPPRDLPVVVEHSGLDDAAGTIAAALVSAGARLVPRDAAQVALAVPIAAHVLPPGAGAAWLGRDVPHLPVVFGDAEAEVGPLVVPGRTACLSCVMRHRLDGDPECAAVATQLLRHRHAPAAAAPVVVHQAIVVLLRAVAGLAHGGARSPLEGRSVRIGEAGILSERRWLPAPDCPCRALPGSAEQSAGQAAPTRPRPRTAAARVAVD